MTTILIIFMISILDVVGMAFWINIGLGDPKGLERWIPFAWIFSKPDNPKYLKK